MVNKHYRIITIKVKYRFKPLATNIHTWREYTTARVILIYDSHNNCTEQKRNMYFHMFLIH